MMNFNIPTVGKFSLPYNNEFGFTRVISIYPQLEYSVYLSVGSLNFPALKESVYLSMVSFSLLSVGNSVYLPMVSMNLPTNRVYRQ